MFRDNKFTLDLNAASRHLKIEKLLWEPWK
jgi:hypothetical protein